MRSQTLAEFWASRHVGRNPPGRSKYPFVNSANHLFEVGIGRVRLGSNARSAPMFGKSDLVDTLNRDLTRARNKRDALASGVTTLNAQIAELESRLSAENVRRERERAASEIEGIKKRVRDGHSAFVPPITAVRNATEVAAPIIPEAREFNGLLEVIATEVANAIHGLLGDFGSADRSGPRRRRKRRIS